MKNFQSLQILIIAAFGLKWTPSSTNASPEIVLNVEKSCKSAVQIEWIVWETEAKPVNCTIFYNTAENYSKGITRALSMYPVIKQNDVFDIQRLRTGENYSVQILCNSVSSDILTFNVSDIECSGFYEDETTNNNEVIVFKEQTSILAMKDSVLGIVFGLFGLLIILVTTFYVLRKVRRRQRLERIRRYLGSSLIDPFQNMQDREPDTGSERLIEEPADR